MKTDFLVYFENDTRSSDRWIDWGISWTRINRLATPAREELVRDMRAIADRIETENGYGGKVGDP